MSENLDRGPLTETVFYILLSLYSPLHGYGIMQKVAEMSDGRVNLGAGTLYGAINTLVKKKWIEPFGKGFDKQKKEYVITELGRKAVGIEITRLKELMMNAAEIVEEGI